MATSLSGSQARREAGRRAQASGAESRAQEVARAAKATGGIQDAGEWTGSEYRVASAGCANSGYRPAKRDGQLVRTVNRVACWASGTIKRNRCPSAVTSN